MPSLNFTNIKIVGIASAIPTSIKKSSDYIECFGEDTVRKFVEMTGVKQHRVSSEHQTASDLGYVAAEKLLTEKNIDRESIGVLIFGAHSTDYRRPATACVLHKRLGLSVNCSAFDIGLGCSAFIYCTQVAASLLSCSDAKRALIIVGETMTKMINPEDKAAAMLFGDGGAAILIEKTDNYNSLACKVCSDGSGYRAIIAPAGGFRNIDASHEPMIWADGNVRTLYNTNMNGADVFAFTITKVPKTIKDFLKETDQAVDQFDCLAFHQANQFIHQQLAKKLKVDISKMPLCLEKYGNTSAPAIPLLLSDFYGNVHENKELNILMCGFGVGLSWGVMSAKINISDILPVIETDDFFAEGIINSPEDM